jgi:acetyl-CoA C-acetyltransferase
MTTAPTLGGHAIKHAVERAGIDGAEVEDVIMGCAMQQGTTGLNIGRLAALARINRTSMLINNKTT